MFEATARNVTLYTRTPPPRPAVPPARRPLLAGAFLTAALVGTPAHANVSPDLDVERDDPRDTVSTAVGTAPTPAPSAPSADDTRIDGQPPIGAAAPPPGPTLLVPPDPLPRVPGRVPDEFELVAGDPLAGASGYLILGLGALPSHRGADRVERTPFLISRFALGRLELAFEGLDWYADALPSPLWRAGMTVAYELPRRSDDGAATLVRESELGLGVAPGVFAGAELPAPMLPEGLASARMSLRTAAGGERAGSALTLDADYFFAATFMWRLGVAARLELADDGWVDSRYGVSAARAASAGAEPYAAAGGLHAAGASAYSIVSLSPTLGLFARYARTELLGDAARSPLVAEPTERFSGMGVFYLF